jgi:two-component system sensor kinase FixL
MTAEHGGIGAVPQSGSGRKQSCVPARPHGAGYNPGMPALAKQAGIRRHASQPRPEYPARLLLGDTAAALLFIACYVCLDWASYIYPLGPFNITPWSPPPALAIVWMLLGGLRYAPVVFVAAFTADFLIRDFPGGVMVTALTSAVLAAGYAAMAAALRRFLPDARLHDTRHLCIFVAVTALGSALVALLYTGTLIVSDYLGRDELASAVFRSWLGDTVGILVTAPLLLAAAAPRERARLASALRKPETVLQLAVMAAVVVAIFRGDGGRPTGHFYVLFLPLVWTALRNGMPGAALATGIVQIGVVLGIQSAGMDSVDVLGLQARVAALTLTGLFLGVIVDERARAAEELRRSQQLAAAGEMAGAIAHEINQPLLALGAYCKACLVLLDRSDAGGAGADLRPVILRMQADARRAADVVVRLRDFFRSGTTRLERVSVESLLDSARGEAARLDPQGHVHLRIERGTDALLLVDRLQIELVLRNLVANAFDALAPLPAERREVVISAQLLSDTRVELRVSDSGPGISPSTRERLFEPMNSNKALGMGLGLAISRAIAEAHEGSLFAPPASHGEFRLVLPVAGADD